MMEQTPEEYTDFVRREYGTGGIGLVIGGKSILSGITSWDADCCGEYGT